ncbi:ATP-dependent DNA ligase [Methylibium petroleiphilum]|uniref:ATP-dependent DNA ligase family profile domain-containing protein n=1 Tax=Methylibium petroleiphilum (strain ATCC BAA-1232 / LMG 22953 / PM1) TaxID=420662 RepID=A2SNA2_METPP|nr:hypothetical protein [Methylibium petroleiphilum]ABM97041.1 hypothetical protein Mpe_B0266 [Methylibium petroleiphilum PM1]
MHSPEIFNLLEQIAAEKKSTGKLALLKAHAGDATLQRVLELALNPLKTYGVKSLPPRGGSGSEPFGDWHWALIERLRTRELTGHAARDEIRRALGALDAGSAALLGRILRKDLRAGISDTTVNKVFAGLIPEFPYMRCSLPKDVKLAEWPWARGVYSQIKADGTFANVSVEQDGQIFVTSRQGSEYPLESFGALADHLAAALAPGFQYHGELLVQRPQGALWETLPREDGNGLLTSILKGGELPADHRIIYQAWDMIPLSVVQPKGRYAVAYEDRFARLKSQIESSAQPDSQVSLIPTRIVHSLEQAYAHYREQLAAGLEGTILKRPDAIWRDGDSKEQCKLKLEVVVELRVVGFNEGSGKNVGALGSFQCVSECGRLRVDVSGRGDKMRAEVWANREDWLDAIISVKANDIMEPESADGYFSLFLPIFQERRLDKKAADTFDRIREQFDEAVKV